MSKTYEALTVRQAAWKIEEDEGSAKRLFNRYVRTLKNRMSTFEKKGLTHYYGYKRLKESLEEAKYGFSPEALSHVSFTLANAYTSYTNQMNINKKIVDKMNVEWGTWDEKTGELIKPFITLDQLDEFAEIMELYKSLTTIYSSEQLAKMSVEYIDIIQEKGLNWEEEKERLLRKIEKETQNTGKFSVRQYTTRMNRRASKK